MEHSKEYWREYYSTHASLNSYKKRVDKAMEVICDFLETGIKSYCSISGGKDSTAMMHLVWRVEPQTVFVSEKDDLDFPEEKEYMELLKNQYRLNLTILNPKVNLWEVLQNHDFTEDIHSAETAFSKEHFYGLLKDFKEANGYEGVFLGLRAKESKGRLHNYIKNGFIYHNKSWNQFVCQPLAQWTDTDVMAYLFSNNIPILDVYFKTKFVNYPHEIRKSWALPSHQSSKGQALWLKYYYPEIFQRLSIINPKMRLYV